MHGDEGRDAALMYKRKARPAGVGEVEPRRPDRIVVTLRDSATRTERVEADG
jgi:hypothetical protein